MKQELHDNPSMGHAKKGSKELKRGKRFETESHAYDWRKHRGGRKAK